MATEPATEEFLAKLHAATANEMLSWLEGGDEVTPQQIAQIIKFLKDNDITAAPVAASPTKLLAAEMNDLDMPDGEANLHLAVNNG